MSRKPTLYIAYGSNLNLEQMSYRCPTAEVAGTAQLQGYEMLFRGGSVRGGRGAVATVEPKKDASVPVLLWNIREKDEQALDRYEGYPHFYRKEQMEVELNGRSVSAMVYVMNPGHELGLPGHSYYQTIAEGYESAGFDLAVLDAAVEESYNRALREERESVHAFDENQLSLFGDGQYLGARQYADILEGMVPNPTPEMTAQWEQYARNAAEENAGGERTDEEIIDLYRDELLFQMENVRDEFGPEILQQIYETGGNPDPMGIAEYLAQGGDLADLENPSDDKQSMHL